MKEEALVARALLRACLLGSSAALFAAVGCGADDGNMPVLGVGTGGTTGTTGGTTGTTGGTTGTTGGTTGTTGGIDAMGTTGGTDTTGTTGGSGTTGGTDTTGTTGGSGTTGGTDATGTTGGTDTTGTTGGTAGTTGGTAGSTGGAAGAETGRFVGDTCYVLCADGSSADANGWGWESGATCIEVGSSAYNEGTPCEADTGGGTGGAEGSTGGTAGNTGGMPGNTGGTPGNTGGTPGNTGGTPGNTGGTPGNTGGTPGNTGGTPGVDSECGVNPVNPNSTAQAKNLLCYLYEVYGNHVLSGQQETSWDWNNPGGGDIQQYVTRYSKYPAILGGDYLYTRGTGSTNGTTDRAIAYWQAGGIPMIRYHMGAPPNGDSYDNSQGTADINAVLTSGTSANTSFEQKLAYVSGELLRLQDANAAVIWAPFHEFDFSGDGWFWWSRGTDPSSFHQLWQYMFNYLVDAGVNNVVWLAPSSGEQATAAWYPDRAYYDIGGPDTYASGPPFTSLYNLAKGIVGTETPVPLHETGYIPLPSTMFPSTAPWVLWNVWAEMGPGGSQIKSSLADFDSAYDSEYTITRDEVPNLK